MRFPLSAAGYMRKVIFRKIVFNYLEGYTVIIDSDEVQGCKLFYVMNNE
jgi:hypothetical protein